MGAEVSSQSDLGLRWPSRLVATAEEDRQKLPAQILYTIFGSD
jgi:hypothetical protein